MFRIRFARPFAAVAGVLAAVVCTHPAPAKPRTVREPDQAETPAARHARLGRKGCLAELRKRQIPHELVESAPGVLVPVRLPEPVEGVRFRSALPSEKRRNAPHDVFDCRLVLSLADWTDALREHDIVEVVTISAWRPSPKGAVPDGRAATRHPGALAVDVRAVVVMDQTGQRRHIEVEHAWEPAIRRPPCGPKASPVAPPGPAAEALRYVTCDAVRRRLFSVVLTPNYNRAHHNHLHLEVTPGVDWYLVR